MDQRLDALVAKSEIADLVHTYALHIRNRTPERCGALFTDDGSFEAVQVAALDPALTRRLFLAEGREAVVAAVGKSAPTSRMFPAIHNLIVTVDGEEAVASSLMIGTRYPGLGETLGEYADRFRKVEGTWLFASRTYTIFRDGPGG